MVFQLLIGWSIIQGKESAYGPSCPAAVIPWNPDEREFVEDLGNYTNWKEGHPGNNYFATIRQVSEISCRQKRASTTDF